MPTQSTPPHVVMLNDTAYINGGAAKVAVMEANGLAERGHCVTFIACDDGGPNQTRVLHPDINLHCTGQEEILDANPLAASIQGIRNTKAVRLVQGVLRKCDRDKTVVHLHAWSKALSAAVVPAILEYRLPLVCTLHEYFSVCPNGAFYNYPKGQTCHLRPMSAACIASNCDARSYSHKLWRVVRFYTQQHWYGMPGQLLYLLTPSHFASQILEPHLPPGSALNVLKNPIDCEQEPPADVGANTRFVYVGRLSAEKGVRLFLQAARQTGVQAAVVGDGPEATQLEQEFPDAEFLGWQPPEQARAIMRTARALVFPSLWYETDGLVVKEAASIGLPAITADASAATDSVTHEQTGLHFSSGNVDELAQAMHNLAEDGSLASRLGTTAYRCFWAEPCTVERHIDELLGHYIRLRAA